MRNRRLRRRPVAAVIVAATLAVVLSACGSSSSEKANDGSTSGPGLSGDPVKVYRAHRDRCAAY